MDTFLRNLLCFLLTFSSLNAEEEHTSRCYGELSDLLHIDEIAQQMIGKPFRVRASMPTSAVNALNMKGHSPVIVSVQLYGDPDEFLVFEPSRTQQDISAGDGIWEWEVKAKEAGEHILFFHVDGVAQNQVLIENCLRRKVVQIGDLPFGVRILNGFAKQWIAILSLVLGFFNAWQIRRTSKKT